MNALRKIKALGNEHRLEILGWLRNPEEHFPPHRQVQGFGHGVCVGFITEKAGLSQSTVSSYMDQLQRAGLVVGTRIGKWTYYKRDETGLRTLAEFIGTEL